MPWPPNRRGPYADLEEWSAWYSGDPKALGRVYGTAGETRRREGMLSTLASRVSFWGRRGEEVAGRQRLHVPVAADIAATSADLLFGEELQVRIPEAHEQNAGADAKAAEDRLRLLTDKIGLTNTLLEGAEVCAAIGGVFLRPGWDQELADHPMLDVIHGDAAVGEWRGSYLLAATFWKEIARDGNAVWRHLERHEPGLILNGLYVGSTTHLGTRVSLDRHPETKGLEEEIRLPAELGQRLLVRYVPNVRPNRKWRGLPIGRADYAQLEGLMDALDETYTSWMRDIRLGQARIIVAEDALQRRGRGEGAYFDADQEVFTPIAMEPSAKASGAPIEAVQFQIRTAEHLETALNLFERIVTSAGYSPQSFGLHIDGAAESGTALRVREGKTLKTRGRKARFWTPAIEDVLEIMLAIDRHILGNREAEVFRPSVDVADVIVNNPIEVAQSVGLFRSAQAMSIETAVRMAQPDLDEAGRQAEVARIQDESAISADPTGGFV